MTTKTPHISVAPMMDWTDRHCRYFHRLIAPNVVLYTEMISTGAILHGDAARHLRFDETEHPVALQLGGADAAALARATEMGVRAGYDEINLNCGCPSDRVQEYEFGACLMKRPNHVADCVRAMRAAASDIPVTVKCRVAVDDVDELPFLTQFIESVADAGCVRFIIHARKAWLQGLSPKENREVPPLRYDIAATIKQNFSQLEIIVNGGIKTVDDIATHLKTFDGVMIGREAYQNPWFLHAIDQTFHGGTGLPDRVTVARAMIPYMEAQHAEFDTPYKSVTRHMIGLFNGLRGGRHWRQILSEQAHQAPNAADLIEQALSKLDFKINL